MTEKGVEKMRNTHKVTMLMAVCCLLTSSLVGAVAQVAAPKRVPERAQWILAIYLVSDNDLDYWAEKDVIEMKMVGSTEDVNVLIFWDRPDERAYAYKVFKGYLEELTDFALNGIEPNMGDPATLEDWVTYTKSRFPSEKYALLMWDHGDKFKGCMYDAHTPLEVYDFLMHQEVVTALNGFHIDVLIYGACILAEIEVVYEYFVGGLDIDYYVANEGYDPMDGFTYDTILTNLTTTPTQSPLELSKMLADDYIYYYEYVGTAYSQAVTLSVVQLDRVGKVVTDLRRMTEAIMVDMEDYAEIVSAARGHANLPWSENGWERLIDLPTFVQTVHDKSLDQKEVKYIDPAVVEAVVSSSETLLTSLDDAILYYRNVKAMEEKGCLGMGIYFPTSRDSYENNKMLYEYWLPEHSSPESDESTDLYALMQFAQEGWLVFLYAYWDVATK